jgi:hypothetical protein
MQIYRLRQSLHIFSAAPNAVNFYAGQHDFLGTSVFYGLTFNTNEMAPTFLHLRFNHHGTSTSVQRIFSKYQPTDTQKEDWKSGARTLRERLKNFNRSRELSYQRSCRAFVVSTAIRPLIDKRPDVDIVVVTNLDHTRISPTDAMDLFIPFLDKYYPGKWETRGRSLELPSPMSNWN